MGLLTKKEQDKLIDLLLKLPNMTDPTVRNQLLPGLPRDLQVQIVNPGAPKPHFISIVNTVDNEFWDEPYEGGWPVIQLVQNAIFYVGKASPLGQKLQTLLDVLTTRAEQWEADSTLSLSKDNSELRDVPNKHAHERKTQERDEPPRAPSVDVGIVIALREEFAEFYDEIKTRCKPIRDEETGRYYYQFEYTNMNLNQHYQCIATFVGEMGAVKASLTTQRLISQWEPRTLVMLGIAAALSKDVRIGDVVIPSQVDAYLENSKAVPGTDGAEYIFTLSGEVYRSSSDLLHTVQHFEFVHPEIFQDWQALCAHELLQLAPRESLDQLISSKRLRNRVQIADGHLASGPTVGAAPAFKDWLKKRDRKYLALEMESGGLMAAVYEQADPKRTLILRGISDDGDEHKKELDEIEDGAFRRYAMRNAIQLLWRFLEAGILPYQ
jgi:nucleoside phosphorylase